VETLAQLVDCNGRMWSRPKARRPASQAWRNEAGGLTERRTAAPGDPPLGAPGIGRRGGFPVCFSASAAPGSAPLVRVAVMGAPVSSVAYAIAAALRALDGHLALLLPTMALVVAIIAPVDAASRAPWRRQRVSRRSERPAGADEHFGQAGRPTHNTARRRSGFARIARTPRMVTLITSVSKRPTVAWCSTRPCPHRTMS